MSESRWRADGTIRIAPSFFCFFFNTDVLLQNTPPLNSLAFLLNDELLALNNVIQLIWLTKEPEHPDQMFCEERTGYFFSYQNEFSSIVQTWHDRLPKLQMMVYRIRDLKCHTAYMKVLQEKSMVKEGEPRKTVCLLRFLHDILHLVVVSYDFFIQYTRFISTQVDIKHDNKQFWISNSPVSSFITGNRSTWTNTQSRGGSKNSWMPYYGQLLP